MINKCRDCESVLNDRRSYPKGWDKGLCESCNKKYETGEREFVIIEQDGDGGAYVTHIDNPEDYQDIGDGVKICLKIEDYYNMCQQGVGG